MKKLLIGIIFILMANLVSAYNLSIEAQLYNGSGNIMTGTYEINITLYNSSDDTIYFSHSNITTDDNGRFFKYLNVSYDFHDLTYINFHVEGLTETNKTLIGHVPYAISAEYLQGYNLSDILDEISNSNTSLRNYISDNYYNETETDNSTILRNYMNNITYDAELDNKTIIRVGVNESWARDSVNQTNWYYVINVSGALNAYDLQCTDCIGATEISDVYVLNTGDTIDGNIVITGNLTVIGDEFIANVTTQNLNGSLLPQITNTFDIGSPGSIWAYVYATSLYGSLGWANLTDYPTGCTNQFVRTIGDTINCASVDSADIATDAIDDDEMDYAQVTLSDFTDDVGYAMNGTVVNITTQFGGEVSGTFDNIVLGNDALDDQYYDSEGDLTTLLDDDYVDVDEAGGSANISCTGNNCYINMSCETFTGGSGLCDGTDADTPDTTINNCSSGGSCSNIAYLNYSNQGNFTVDSPTFFVDSVNNRVGIGTTTPAHKLEVSGSMNISGDLNVSGLITGSLVGAYSNTNFTSDYYTIADRYGDANFTADYGAVSYYTLTNFTANYYAIGSRYDNSNLTSDYPNLDTDSTNDYATTDFTTDYLTMGAYKKANLTIDYPDLDTDKTDDLDAAKLDNKTIIRTHNTSWLDSWYSAISYFKQSNFTALYYAVADRYGDANFTADYGAVSYYTLTNFTANYYAIGSRYDNSNLTSDYPNLDTDSTNDYATTDFNTDYYAIGSRYDTSNHSSETHAYIGNCSVSGGCPTIAYLNYSNLGNFTIDTFTFHVDSTNNRVGIGTASPSAKLDVNGSIIANSFNGSWNGSSGITRSYTIILLPDTQKYSEKYPEIFTNQTKWITDNADELNIKFVIHLGDIVEDAGNLTQWNRSNSSMNYLDNHSIPYSTLAGNHDIIGSDYTNYSLYFPLSRFSSKSGYGGAFDSTAQNMYFTFEFDNEEFIFISLSYNPNATVLNWADDVLSNFSNHTGIISTHNYMEDDGSRTTTGNDIFDNLTNNENFFSVFCADRHGGTAGDDGEAMRVDLNNFSKPVYQVLQDYQDFPSGGSGFLRIVTITPKTQTYSIKTFSPYLDNFRRKSKSEFVFNNYIKGPFYINGSLIVGQINSSGTICDGLGRCIEVVNPLDSNLDVKGYNLTNISVTSYINSSYGIWSNTTDIVIGYILGLG